MIVKTNSSSAISADNSKQSKIDDKYYNYSTIISEYECAQMSLSLMPAKLII